MHCGFFEVRSPASSREPVRNRFSACHWPAVLLLWNCFVNSAGTASEFCPSMAQFMYKRNLKPPEDNVIKSQLLYPLLRCWCGGSELISKGISI